MATTAANLIVEAKVRSDQEKRTFVSDTQWLIWISDGYLALYDLLVESFQDYFWKMPSPTLTPDVNGLLTLPTDFYKLRGLNQVNSGSAEGTPVSPYLYEERGAQRRRGWYGRSQRVGYQILGSSFIQLRPAEGAVGQTYTLDYVPLATKITNPSTLIDGMNGWEQFIAIDAAIKATDKEESDSKPLRADRADIVRRIELMAKNRDLSRSGRIRDVRPARGYGYGWGDEDC